MFCNLLADEETTIHVLKVITGSIVLAGRMVDAFPHDFKSSDAASNLAQMQSFAAKISEASKKLGIILDIRVKEHCVRIHYSRGINHQAFEDKEIAKRAEMTQMPPEEGLRFDHYIDVARFPHVISALMPEASVSEQSQPQNEIPEVSLPPEFKLMPQRWPEAFMRWNISRQRHESKPYSITTNGVEYFEARVVKYPQSAQPQWMRTIETGEITVLGIVFGFK